MAWAATGRVDTPSLLGTVNYNPFAHTMLGSLGPNKGPAIVAGFFIAKARRRAIAFAPQAIRYSSCFTLTVCMGRHCPLSQSISTL